MVSPMTTLKPEKPAGRNVVRKKLADGTIKEYIYQRKAKEPSRFLQSTGHGFRSINAAYTKSPEFKALSQSWQAATFYYLGIIENRLGWATIENLCDHRIRTEFYALRDEHAAHPAKADKITGVLGTVLSWAYERRIVTVNHAKGIDRLGRGGRRADKIWDEAMLAQLLAHASPDLSRMVRLALLTAARLGDLRRLRWSDYRDGWITYTPSKTAKMVPPPIVRLPVMELPQLGELLEECRKSGAETILATEARGIPWGTPNFNARWKEALAKAGLLDADRHFHDIRGTVTTQLLEAGCTDAETAAITGHSIGGRSMLRAYAARTDGLSIAAYRKLKAHLAARPAILAFPVGNKPRRQND
jgi:integrase